MEISKKKKQILFFSFFILTIIGIFAIVINPLSPLSPFEVDEGNLYITSGNVVRNFKLESFDGNEITSGGTVIGLDDRLKFETGAIWKADTDAINLQYAEQVNDIVYASYDVIYTIEMNAYTNLDLGDAIEEGKTADPVKEQFHAGFYGHYDALGTRTFGWHSYLEFNHLDIGNVREHNEKNNKFSGNLVMSFDIDPTPLPDTLTDSNGNPANKKFDYIAIKYITTSDSLYGHLSDDVPKVVGLAPAEYESSRSTISGGDVEGRIVSKYEGRWDPNPILSDTFISSTFDYGIQYQSDGSSLNPKQKDGSPIFDPRASEESMTDCKFTLNIGSLTPLITTYSNTLTYYEQTLHTQDYLKSLIPWSVGIRVSEDSNLIQSYTRPTALHVTNRYIHTKIVVAFTVWTSYQIVPIEGDVPGLMFPEEYYDNLVFDATVDGFGGGQVYSEGYTTKLFDLGALFGGIGGYIILIIVIIIIAVVLYVFLKVGIPYLRSRTRRKEHEYYQQKPRGNQN